MVAPTLSVESTFGGAGQQNQISLEYVPSRILLRRWGGRRSRVQSTREESRWAGESQVLAVAANLSDDDAETPFFWRTAATPG